MSNSFSISRRGAREKVKANLAADLAERRLAFRDELRGKALIWYNTLWDTLCGGHDDDLSLEDPDAAFGYLIDTLGARIIQTDRAEHLLTYLRDRGLHR